MIMECMMANIKLQFKTVFMGYTYVFKLRNANLEDLDITYSNADRI